MRENDHLCRPNTSDDPAIAMMTKEHRYLTDKTNIAMIIAGGLRGGRSTVEIGAMLHLYKRITDTPMTNKDKKAAGAASSEPPASKPDPTGTP